MSATPFTVKAVFEYTSDHDDDLTFSIGQIITVVQEEDDDWYLGEYTDETGAKAEGIFPKNFVEKYDPPAPPRPARPNRPKKEAEPVPVPVSAPPEPAAVETPVVERHPEPEPEPAPAVVESPTAVAGTAPHLPTSPPVVEEPSVSAAPVPQPAPAQASVPQPEPTPPAPKLSSKPAPPPVTEKPTGSSFKDRIAAFNKPAAPPIAPFKPSGLGGQSFIKKPFVAPPPSKNAYVPPPREPPPKIYRREEDPEVQERVAREPPVSERSPPVETPAEAADDQPKPTSLKERIALLQKQQMEQAARHAEAAQKKEKPKKAPKPRAESTDEGVPAGDDGLERPEAAEAARDHSTETVKPTAPAAPQLPIPLPVQELASDTNDADDSAPVDSEDAEETSTSKEDYEDRTRVGSRHGVPLGTDHKAEKEERDQEAQSDDEAEPEEEAEEEMDPETKRKMELRERMAKMSGGMGMMGFFGAPGGMPMPGAAPRKPKTSVSESSKKPEDSESAPAAAAPPVPVMAMPGMAKPTAPSVEKDEEETPVSPTQQRRAEDVPDVEEVVPEPPRRVSLDRTPSLPQGHAAPPLPPVDTRPVPPPVPQGQPSSPPPVPGGRPVPPPVRSPTSGDEGDESDDELSVHARNLSLNAAAADRTVVSQADSASSIPEHLDSRRPSTYDIPTPTSPSEKRQSRAPPPVPTNPPVPAQSRPPPPPPPGPPRRRSTADSQPSTASQPRQAGEEAEGEITEYDGDYDTDIASGAKFKDALKSHGRDSSVDDGTITDDHSLQSPRSPRESRAPPHPPPSAPRAVPPPPPIQPPKSSGGRSSLDSPRGPPPPPPHREQSFDEDEEYDPYRYTAPMHGLPATRAPPLPPVVQHPQLSEESDDVYDTTSPTQPPPERSTASSAKRASVSPLPPSIPSVAPPATPRSARASLDVPRGQPMRRSMDVARPSADQSYIATDVDLAEGSLWWSQPNTPPPVFQNRKDILLEIEESSAADQGSKAMVAKDVYVLFLDYSQTVITVSYDPRNPADASLEQRHEAPPVQLRQDQLENAHLELGTRISSAVQTVQNTTVGDGTPFGLVRYLLEPLSGGLRPVGTRAYGALVYSNLANASVQQNDEIRAGDIVSFRNARFQGHRGTMHQKYSSEVGKPDHVGVVVDWDGTKKKIRAWEQGRESKKVKIESFKLSDLRSGECKVWRVMPRSWVGWDK